MICVIKIGGSLDADPGRRRDLLDAVATGAHGPCIVVPGGGALADSVRAAQEREGFDDARAHRLALEAMGRMAARFRAIEPRLPTSSEPWADFSEVRKFSSAVWDPAALIAGHPDISETWDVTSDSLALWLAARVGARRCVLVKSVDAALGQDAADLARRGYVDAAFPGFAARFSGAIEIWGPSGPTALARCEAA